MFCNKTCCRPWEHFCMFLCLPSTSVCYHTILSMLLLIHIFLVCVLEWIFEIWIKMLSTSLFDVFFIKKNLSNENEKRKFLLLMRWITYTCGIWQMKVDKWYRILPLGNASLRISLQIPGLTNSVMPHTIWGFPSQQINLLLFQPENKLESKC